MGDPGTFLSSIFECMKAGFINCYFLLSMYIFVSHDACSQRRRIILKENGIKRIKEYHADHLGVKYLSSISYLNDSGLVYRNVSLNKEQDTTDIRTYVYDSLNREVQMTMVFTKDSFFKKDSVMTHNYAYLEDGTVVTAGSKPEFSRSQKTVAKRKGRKELYYDYSGGKLRTKRKYVKRKQYTRFVIRPKNNELKYHKTHYKGREYHNQLGQLTKVSRTSYHKVRIDVKGDYRKLENGKVVKNRFKYRTYRYKRTNLSESEYDSRYLLIKQIDHAVPEYKKSAYFDVGQDYSRYTYEYLND